MEPHEIVALAEMVKSVSEIVWNIALLKVQADAMVCLWWGFVLFAGMLALVVATITSIRHRINTKDYDWDGLVVVSVLGTVGFLIGSTAFFAASLMRFIAPAYFAIQIIRDLT